MFEIMRESGLVATSDEHKTAKGAARAGKPIWRRTVKSAKGKAGSMSLKNRRDLTEP